MASRKLKFNKMVGTVEKLVEAGVMEEPKWLAAVRKRPPIYDIARDSKKSPPKLTFPEDRFVQSFQDRYPHMQKQAIDLLADDVPPARRFALRQLELVESGMPVAKARRLVDKQFREDGLIPPNVEESSAIRRVQLLEEVELQEAVSQTRISSNKNE